MENRIVEIRAPDALAQDAPRRVGPAGRAADPELVVPELVVPEVHAREVPAQAGTALGTAVLVALRE